MTTIYLVRHGENNWVRKNRLAGWIDGVHLNDNGRKQAQSVAKRLAPLSFDAIYTSPVTRCVETAEYIARQQQQDLIELEDMGEVRYGDWEGKKIKKLTREKLWFVVQFFPSRLRFPNGEALREVQFRAVQCIETVCTRHPKENIVIVSHADIIKLVLAHYLGVHMDLFQRIAIAPASVSVVALPENGMVRVLRLNDDGPLRPSPKKKKKKSK